jgi:hypothetical protein
VKNNNLLQPVCKHNHELHGSVIGAGVTPMRSAYHKSTAVICCHRLTASPRRPNPRTDHRGHLYYCITTAIPLRHYNDCFSVLIANKIYGMLQEQDPVNPSLNGVLTAADSRSQKHILPNSCELCKYGHQSKHKRMPPSTLY